MRVMCSALIVLTAISSAPALGQDGVDEFEKLNGEFDKVWTEWRQKSITARRAGASPDEMKAIRAKDPTRSYIDRYQAGAKKHAGTDAAFPYLNWLVGRACRFDRAVADMALDQIVASHLGHEGMKRFAFSIALRASRDGLDRKKTLNAQELIAAKAKSDEDRADALYWRAYVISKTESTDAERQRALRDLKITARIGNDRMKAQAKGMAFMLERLQIGMVAPDIEGADTDGVTFKLSDYRGKVVFLDFWGHW